MTQYTDDMISFICQNSPVHHTLQLPYYGYRSVAARLYIMTMCSQPVLSDWWDTDTKPPTSNLRESIIMYR